MDPISGGLAVAGLIASLMKQRDARNLAATNYANQQAQLGEQRQIGYQAYNDQQKALADALLAARSGQADVLRSAGGVRTDQFGNTTYYDPRQGRWITALTPEQQYLQNAEQAQRGRALARGAQASEDYARERAGYLYKTPPGEAEIQDQIAALLQQARGTGERELNTLANRVALRTVGNVPQVQQRSTAQTAGELYAKDALQARQQALAEYQSRLKQHQEEYLPAMQEFEKTADYMPAEGPTGRQVAGLAAQGGSDILGALSNYEKLVPSVIQTGAKGLESASNTLSKGISSAYGGAGAAGAASIQAANAGPNLGQFAALIKAIQPSGKTGTSKLDTSLTPSGPTAIGTPEFYMNPDTPLKPGVDYAMSPDYSFF